MADCADLLGHPEVLANDLAESLAMIRSWREALLREGVEFLEEEVDRGGDVRAFFYPSREISVLGAPCSFTCLATGLDPLGCEGEEREPIDFAAVTCDEDRNPVLGAVQSDRDASAYPLLLRGLATLVEMASTERLAAIDERVFRGFLGATPSFDLDLVLFEAWGDRERIVVEQLTRDLSERALVLMRGTTSCGDLVRSVVCLRMNPERVDFRLRFGWRV